MSTEKFVARSAVFVALRNGRGEVLLHRRANTGYMDGYYDLPSGHVERGERLLDAAVRELMEETGIKVVESALTLWHINQFNANGEAYYNFFFVTNDWVGEPAIMERDKCDDMGFYGLDALPPLTAGSHTALPLLDKTPVTYGFIDQAAYDSILRITASA